VTKLARLGIATLLVFAMAACGGGGGSAGSTIGTGSGGSTGGTGSSTDGTVMVALMNTVGVESNSVSSGKPLVAKATVKDANGVAVKNTVVTFTLSSAVATMSPSTGTALTDSSGVAQISIEAGSSQGAATVTASAIAGGSTAVTSLASFAVGAAPSATPAAIDFKSAIPSDKSIVIKGAGGSGRTEVALLSFKVVDSSGAGVANVKVDFTKQSNSSVTLVNTSGTTGQDGQVTATVNSGDSPTTVRVIATVPGTPISALSDTVTVTTGQPVQLAFSPSVETFNISGWRHDNIKSKVNILMADQNGNPVADGTPVIFTTDSGAIGSSNAGGCTTVNGGCSVDFRSQNPRYGKNNSAGKTPGLATITVSSTSGSATLTGTVQITLSDDVPRVFVGVPGVELAANASSINLSTSVCTAYSLVVTLKDLNDNPMPAGTKVEAVDATDVTITEIFPATVPNQLALQQHIIPIKPDATKCAETGSNVGSFRLKVTAPLGAAYGFLVNLTYP